VQAVEGGAGVCAELRNRGVADVLIVCCDRLTGFPEAIEATKPAVRASGNSRFDTPDKSRPCTRLWPRTPSQTFGFG